MFPTERRSGDKMSEKRLLITGFDPFGGETLNPSWEAVRRLPDTVGGFKLTKLEIPTEFQRASKTLLAAAENLRPDAILCVGQAGGRVGVTPEAVGINLREARIADNAGFRPCNTPVIPGGPVAYFATLPVREMVAAIQTAGLPASLSLSAGAFVCNDVLYTVLHRYAGTDVKAGFIHVPFLPEQAKENVPCMTLEQIVCGLTAAIETL